MVVTVIILVNKEPDGFQRGVLCIRVATPELMIFIIWEARIATTENNGEGKRRS